ncbi:MAG: SH3 domain-containing protein [Robiginitomaculum sp.]
MFIRFFSILCAAALILIASPLSFAGSSAAASTKPASQTPSGFAVPRFVSLKYGSVNGRSGPGQDHSVKWSYKRRGMPVIIIAETEMWRKVRDFDGDESWMHKRTLKGERMVITLKDVTLRAKPRKTAKGRAIAAKDSLLMLENCDDAGWCKVKAQTGHWGYAPMKTLWGAQAL